MPHWLQLLAAIAGALASWRWVIRPARRFAREAISLLKQIRESSGGVRVLASEMRELAGAVVQMAAALKDGLDRLREDQAQLRAEHEATTRLVIDLDADIRRLQRAKGTDP